LALPRALRDRSPLPPREVRDRSRERGDRRDERWRDPSGDRRADSSAGAHDARRQAVAIIDRLAGALNTARDDLDRVRHLL